MFTHSPRCSRGDKQGYTHVGTAVSCVWWAFSHSYIRGLESCPEYFVVVGIVQQEISACSCEMVKSILRILDWLFWFIIRRASTLNKQRFRWFFWFSLILTVEGEISEEGGQQVHDEHRQEWHVGDSLHLSAGTAVVAGEKRGRWIYTPEWRNRRRHAYETAGVVQLGWTQWNGNTHSLSSSYMGRMAGWHTKAKVRMGTA